MYTMADWSQLPYDLLTLIGTHLETQFDKIRFRSVCTTWRKSLPSPQPLSLPMLPTIACSNSSLDLSLSMLSIRTILSLSSPSSNSSWIVKIAQDNNFTNLINPLGKCSLVDIYFKKIDLMDIRVSQLGFQYMKKFYVNQNWNFGSSISDAGNLYTEKVAFCHDQRIGYVLLTIHVRGKLAMLKVGDKKWTIIEDFPLVYNDVALFKGRFYAVDVMGTTLVVGLDPLSPYSPVVELVADPIFGGDNKTLVASNGELLLVDTYLSVEEPEDEIGSEEEAFYENFDYYMNERTIRFKVFRLNWEEKKWNEVKDLGDRMLFLGDYCTFSAPASDFNGCKGNCIIFAGRNYYSSWEEDDSGKGHDIGVFDLESGSIGSLANHPGYSKMFWLPPSWASAATLEVSMTL